MTQEKIIQFKKREKTEHSLSKGYVLYNEGKCLYNRNEDDIALQKFIQAEKLGFESDEMFACMAWLFGRDSQNIEIVLKYADKAIELDNENSYAYYLKGFTLYDAERYKEALPNFLKAEDLGYEASLLLTRISYCYEHLGENLKAIAYASKAIKKFPNDVDCYRRKAWAYFSIGNNEQALNYFLEAEKRGDTQNHFRISYCYSELGDHKAALSYANKAIIADRNNYYGYYRKGFVYYMTGEYEKALKEFLKTEELVNEDTSIIYDMYPRISWIYQSILGDVEKGREYAELGLSLNPKYDFAQYRMGCVYSYGYKKYKEAMKYFRKAYKLANPFPELYYDMAQTCLNMKRYKLGLKYANEGLEMFPDSFDIKTVKIAILYLAKDIKQSKDMLEELLKQQPDDVWLHQAYGLILAAHKEYEKSIQHFEPIKHELAQCNPFAIMGLSIAYMHTKRYEESLATFVEYTRKENIEYIEKKDVKEIKKVLNRLTKKFPNDERIEEIKRNFAKVLE